MPVGYIEQIAQIDQARQLFTRAEAPPTGSHLSGLAHHNCSLSNVPFYTGANKWQLLTEQFLILLSAISAALLLLIECSFLRRRKMATAPYRVVAPGSSLISPQLYCSLSSVHFYAGGKQWQLLTEQLLRILAHLYCSLSSVPFYTGEKLQQLLTGQLLTRLSPQLYYSLSSVPFYAGGKRRQLFTEQFLLAHLPAIAPYRAFLFTLGEKAAAPSLQDRQFLIEQSLLCPIN